MQSQSTDHPLAPLVNLWTSLMQRAVDHKWRAFGRTADECWKFFDGAHDFMYKNASDSIGMYVEGDTPKTAFKMTLNKVAELVQLFGPTMYYKNPSRQVNPKKPEVPQLALQMIAQQEAQAMLQQQMLAQQQMAQQMSAMGGAMSMPPMGPDFGAIAQMQPPQMDPMQQQMLLQQMQQQIMMTYQQELQGNQARDEAVAELIQWILNFTPNEFDLKGESRKAIDEALIKGRGVVIHEMYKPPGSNVFLPRTSWVSVDDLLIDPDARTVRDATWIAIRCQEPRWQVERDRGLEDGELQHVANAESTVRASAVDTGKYGSYYRRKGDSHDLVTYYKIWSKAGMGHHLTQGSGRYAGSEVEPLQDMLAAFGDYCYLEVCEGVDYPLNLPNALMDADATEPGVMEEVQKRVSWPVPFYRDGGWPVTELDFHVIPGSPWPQAHMKPALGELRFLNWAMSFLAGRIRITSRVFVALADHLDEDIRDDIENGGDLTILKLKMNINKSINEVVQFLQHPEANQDIWKIIEAVMVLFDKRVGLTDLVYGLSGKQMRSAQEAQVKEERTSVRPDDMAETVESWQTMIARKEGQMLRLFCGPESVSPAFGEMIQQPQPEPPPMPGMPPPPPPPPQLGVMSKMWQQFVYLPVEGGDQNVERVFREFEYRIESGSVRKPNVERDQANMDQAMQVLFQPLLGVYQTTGDPTQINAFITDWAKTRQLDAASYLFQPFQPAPPMPAEGQPQQQEAA